MAYIPTDEWIVLYEFREYLRDNPNLELLDSKGHKKPAHEILSKLDELSSQIPDRGVLPFLYNKLFGNADTNISKDAKKELVNSINHYINSSSFKAYVKPWKIMATDTKSLNLIFDDKVANNLAYFFKKPNKYNFLFSITNSLYKKLLKIAGNTFRKKLHENNIFSFEMYMQPSIQKWIYIAVLVTLFASFGMGGLFSLLGIGVISSISGILGFFGIQGTAASLIANMVLFLSALSFYSFLASTVTWASRKLSADTSSHFSDEFTPVAQLKKTGINSKALLDKTHDMTNFYNILSQSVNKKSVEEHEHKNPDTTTVTMRSKIEENKEEIKSPTPKI